MAPLPPVRKRASYSTIQPNDLVFALYQDRVMPPAVMQSKNEQPTSGEAIKASRRHSAADIDYGLQARAKLREADALMVALGFDDTPDPAIVPWEGKALDYATHCTLVKAAIHEALEEAEELDDDEQPMGMVQLVGDDDDCLIYDDYAIACLDDGRQIKIPYRLDGYDIEVSDPDDWTLVEADWSDVSDYEPEAVKMLDDNRVRGLAIRFGSPDEPDLSEHRDFFTKSTDAWLDRWGWLDGANNAPMLYHHAQDDHTKDAPVVGVWTKAYTDDVGVWLEGQLDMAHRYGTAVKELIRRGILRLSSDSAPHLVQRERQPNGTNWIKRWPLITASLTPSPAEPRMISVSALKAAFHEAGLLPPAELIDDSAETDDPEGTREGHSLQLPSDTDVVAIELELIEIARQELA